ncbi:hypothetical protein ASE11_19060 [Hydrogenophaga sp. Root209]|uniref:hypothetical protein n=1 Tax=Hydrogenophaga sp. Root209 TaxID=1736490 RepID=UPI0006FAA292|nr:hypothetical protein [Hydrogenophaga sp. Root209]KRC11509.1 hypothetical protein ASE11_19060 [Hydrogenophaga sp. Root209]
MPTPDRRPRARRKQQEAELGSLELLRAMHAAGTDPQAWAALRPQAIRTLTTGARKPVEAAGIFDAYSRKPHFLPSLPPPNLTEESKP